MLSGSLFSKTRPNFHSLKCQPFIDCSCKYSANASHSLYRNLGNCRFLVFMIVPPFRILSKAFIIEYRYFYLHYIIDTRYCQVKKKPVNKFPICSRIPFLALIVPLHIDHTGFCKRKFNMHERYKKINTPDNHRQHNDQQTSHKNPCSRSRHIKRHICIAKFIIH